MKLLMHICCASCAVYPVQTLVRREIEIVGLWFNPNIHPMTEYRARLNSLRLLQRVWNMDICYTDYYGLTDFVRNVAHREGERCRYCYEVRLDHTAKTAREMGMDGFSSSLLVSPYQKRDLILKTGRAMADTYDIEFVAEDFRHGYREGLSQSKQLGIYQQKYCGCVYSEMERFQERPAT